MKKDMTSSVGENGYFADPLVPLLLTAENEQNIMAKFSALKESLTNNPGICVKTLALALANNYKSSSNRGIAVYNTAIGQLDFPFISKDSIDLKSLENRPLAFMLTGVGNQYINMAKGLYQKGKNFKKHFDYCCSFLEPLLNLNLKDVLFPDSIRDTVSKDYEAKSGFNLKGLLDKSCSDLTGKEEKLLAKTEYLHPLLFIVEYLIAQILISWGITPAALIGHSIGEYVVACVSGVLSLEDALTLVTKRAQLIETLPQGMMLTVLVDEDKLKPILKDYNSLSMAAVNSLISCTVSGAEKDIIEFEEELGKREIMCLRLPTTRAFHSSMMSAIEPEFIRLFDNIRLNKMKIPFLSNLTGDWATDKQLADINNWFLHTCSAVQFSMGIKKLLEVKNIVLLELGPGQTLTGFTFQHNFKKQNPNGIILSALKNTNDMLSDDVFLFNALCKLWINGVKINWGSILKST